MLAADCLLLARDAAYRSRLEAPVAEEPKKKQESEAEASPPEKEQKAGAEEVPPEDEHSFVWRLTTMPVNVAGGMASGAARIVSATAGASMRVGRAMLRPERLEMMRETGAYLRDAREVAGLTLMELSEALDLEDKSLLEAVENGTATVSFEFILRIAALVARHDPVPFVMRMTRTYNPTVWRILHDWGVGRMTLQFEREREFINIMRKHDAVRQLSDQGFHKVLEFTRAAFEMALFYAVAEEGISDRVVDVDEAAGKAKAPGEHGRKDDQ